MVRDLNRLLNRAFRVIPTRYWYAGAGLVISGLTAATANTILNRPAVHTETAVHEASAPPAVAKKQKRGTKKVPPVIGGGNIFRKERKNYAPPPPPPAKSAEKKAEKPVKFALLGTIITYYSKTAIIGRKDVKTVPKKKHPVNICGALTRQKPKPAPKKKEREKYIAHSVREGGRISDYVLDKVYEDRVEVVGVNSGVRQVVYLPVEIEEVSGEPTRVAKKETVKKQSGKPNNISGAKTK